MDALTIAEREMCAQTFGLPDPEPRDDGAESEGGETDVRPARGLVAPLRTLRERQIESARARAADHAMPSALAVAGVLDVLPDTLHEADISVILDGVRRLIERSRNVQRTVAGCDLDIEYALLVLDERIALQDEEAAAEREAEALS